MQDTRPPVPLFRRNDLPPAVRLQGEGQPQYEEFFKWYIFTGHGKTAPWDASFRSEVSWAKGSAIFCIDGEFVPQEDNEVAGVQFLHFDDDWDFAYQDPLTVALLAQTRQKNGNVELCLVWSAVTEMWHYILVAKKYIDAFEPLVVRA